MDISGKVAIVTGAASGLGAATAKMLSSAGARVALLDRREIAAPFLDSIALAVDVSDAAAMEQAVAKACGRFGPVHLLVNCAGINDPARVVGKEGPVALDRFVRVIQVNLIGTFNAIRVCASEMAKNEPSHEGERGVIVNTASVAAFDGQIGQSAYAASKGGVVGMTLPLARDLARHGIRVMTIAPGIFDTPMLAALSDEARASLGAQAPFPSRLGRPEEYAQLVRSIIENPMLNGEVIRLDGALRMAPK